MHPAPSGMTRAERQFLKSLHQKKNRYRYRTLLIEGEKLICEAIDAHYPLEKVYYSDHISDSTYTLLQSLQQKKAVSHADIEVVSTHKNPEGVIATTVLPDSVLPNPFPEITTAIYLWQINDPGNLGAILRTAAWFGINHVFLSPDSVDPYSPKVIRGSMGAIFRLGIWQHIPPEKIESIVLKQGLELLAADMSGTPPDNLDLDRWLLVLGNESHGLPKFIIKKSAATIGVQRFGFGESLNLSVSAGIIIHELYRIKRSV